MQFKSGFVNIFGPPNAGKSTLMNALLGENLAITSHKVQTTRHRILGILSEDNYQIIFSDTPGIIQPKYKLHEKMMKQIDQALEDSDVALIMVDVNDDPSTFAELINPLNIKCKRILIVNKTDTIDDSKKLSEKLLQFQAVIKADDFLAISALKKSDAEQVINLILKYLPEGLPYYHTEDISDRPVKFFVSEIIRKQIYILFEQEIPYHTAILIRNFEEKKGVTVITADVIVTRETQKGIIIGKSGQMIKKLGTMARQEIEQFLGKKVFLELFVKVRPKWRENDIYLKEYGY